MSATLTTASEVAALLGLPPNASEMTFVKVAAVYRLDAQAERVRGNEVHSATLYGLAEIASQGAQLARNAEAVRLAGLLGSAVDETVPVGGGVRVDRERDHWSITVHHVRDMVVRVVHADMLIAVSNASRALLARDGAEGPACDALRKAVG